MDYILQVTLNTVILQTIFITSLMDYIPLNKLVIHVDYKELLNSPYFK